MKPRSLAALAAYFVLTVPALALERESPNQGIRSHGNRDMAVPARAKPQARHTGLKTPKDWDLGVTHLKTGAQLAGVLPAHWDWREKGALTPVKDQKQCGSCYAFGSTATFESAIKRKDGKELDLSEEQIVSGDPTQGGCSGGFFAHDFQVKNGQALEAACPYTADETACPSGLAPAAKLDSWAFVGSRGRRPTRDELKTAIYQHGPLTSTISANDAFQAYAGGVFRGCAYGQTNHMINLVGWDDVEGVWYLRNSWSEAWGEAGYAKVPYGCSRVGEMAAYVVYKPACTNTPHVKLPREVRAGRDGAELGVEPQAGAFYRWLVDGEPVANRSSKLKVKPRSVRHYTLKVTTECGEAESTVRVMP